MISATKTSLSIATALSIAFCALNAKAETCLDESANGLFVYGTIDGLLAGAYDGDMTIKELSQKGDFGLGTFERLDGELIMLGGVTYHARADGTVAVAAPSQRTPLAYVLPFKASDTFALGEVKTTADIEKAIDARVSNKNLFYGVRVSGSFAEVTTRAIAPQSKPYRPLAVVSKEQQVFKRADVSGTLVGIRSPAFSKGISVPGWHWHFIDDSHRFGGHVLASALTQGVVKIAPASEFDVQLPNTDGFAAADQARDRSQELHQVEKGRD